MVQGWKNAGARLVGKRRREPDGQPKTERTAARDDAIFNLGRSEQEHREAGIKKVAQWLADTTYDDVVGETEDGDSLVYMRNSYRELCKGMWFCIWHSDKPEPQRKCAEQIAALLKEVPEVKARKVTKKRKVQQKDGKTVKVVEVEVEEEWPALRVLWIEAMFDELRDKWPGLDKYRVDKYLYFIRVFAKAAFAELGKMWGSKQYGGQAQAILDLFTKELYTVDTNGVAAGIALQLVDVCVAEIKNAECPPKVAADILGAYVLLFGNSKNPLLVTRITNRVFTEEAIDQQEVDFDVRRLLRHVRVARQTQSLGGKKRLRELRIRLKKLLTAGGEEDEE